MGYYMTICIGFLILVFPSFLFILFEKCLDLLSYRKLRMTKKIRGFLLLEFLILIVAYLLDGIATGLCFTNEYFVTFTFLIPFAMPVLSFFPTWLLELKGVGDETQNRSLKTKFFVVNSVLAFAFIISELMVFILNLNDDSTNEALDIRVLISFIIYCGGKFVIQKIITRKKPSNAVKEAQ